MNNKLIGYEEAKERLRLLEKCQRSDKKWISTPSLLRNTKRIINMQIRIRDRKEEINLLLSIIHAHKQARKYYGKMKKLYTAVKNERQA